MAIATYRLLAAAALAAMAWSSNTECNDESCSADTEEESDVAGLAQLRATKTVWIIADEPMKPMTLQTIANCSGTNYNMEHFCDCPHPFKYGGTYYQCSAGAPGDNPAWDPTGAKLKAFCANRDFIAFGHGYEKCFKQAGNTNDCGKTYKVRINGNVFTLMAIDNIGGTPEMGFNQMGKPLGGNPTEFEYKCM